MAIIVEPVQRCQKAGDKISPQLYYLKRKANDSRLYNTKHIMQKIEEPGGISAEDVGHVVAALVRNIKHKLVDDDNVKLGDLGVFYATFHNKETANSEERTIKNIDKVSIRFLTDNGLHPVNDSGVTTEGSPNNVAFSLYNPKEGGPSDGGGSGSGDNEERQDSLG